jgi:hypothetical protein
MKCKVAEILQAVGQSEAARDILHKLNLSLDFGLPMISELTSLA